MNQSTGRTDSALQPRSIGQPCPECGAQMRQIGRTRENGITYIWFECIQRGCHGRLLYREGPSVDPVGMNLTTPPSPT